MKKIIRWFNNRDELLESLKNEFKANFAEYGVVYFDEENYEVFGFIDETLSPLELHKFSLKEISKRLYLDEQETLNELEKKSCLVEGDDAYQLIAQNKDDTPLRFLAIKRLDKKHAITRLLKDNRVKDDVFKAKFKRNNFEEDDFDRFLSRVLKDQDSAYGLATCENIRGGTSDVTVYFNKWKKRPPNTGYWYGDNPVELLSWSLDDTIRVVCTDGSFKSITYKEAAETCENYYIRGDRVYEIDAWHGPILPNEIEDLRIISEEECVDWMIANTPQT